MIIQMEQQNKETTQTESTLYEFCSKFLVKFEFIENTQIREI
jgi:hypothetical protein